MGRLSKIKRELVLEANKRLLNEHLNTETGHYKVKLDMCKTNHNEWCCMTAFLDGVSISNPQQALGTKVKYFTNMPWHQNEAKHPNGECGIISDIKPWVMANSQTPVCANYVALLTTMSDSAYDDCCVPDDVPGCTDETAINYDSNATIDDGSCEYMRYRCKGPRRQVRERVEVDNTSSMCVEDENGEFASLQACRENCEAGYGPGYEPDNGTAAG